MTPTIADIINTIKTNHEEFGITLYDEATDFDIAEFEKNKLVLPQDIKAFYKFSNGFYSKEDMFRIIPLDEVISNGCDNYIEGEYAFHIAEYMIYCDMWTLSINPKDKNVYTIYNKTNELVILTNSFAEFLERFLSGGVFKGLYDWREQIISNRKPTANNT